MSTSDSSTAYEPMPLVIAAADEGVQLNHGRRFAFVGAGFRLPHISAVLVALAKTIDQHFPAEQKDKKLKIAASEENAWFKQTLKLNDWDETNASMQQHLAALAEQEQLEYVGILPFADPQELAGAVKGHMVRPHNLHLANKVCLTIAGGEQTYNLGQYLLSVDWLAEFTKHGKQKLKEAKELVQAQLTYLRELNHGKDLPTVIEDQGPLSSQLVEENRQLITKILL